MASYCSTFFLLVEPPRITTHPQELQNVVPGQTVSLNVDAVGTEPLTYQWQWKPSGEGDGQLCDVEYSDGTTLTIPSVQKLNEGIYQCVISNCAGSQISSSAEVSIGKTLDIKIV